MALNGGALARPAVTRSPATPPVERRRVPREEARHVGLWVAAAATVGLAVTVALTVVQVVAFAYRSVPLHVAMEITATLAAVVAAQLVHGRFRSTLQRSDLVLFAALLCSAASNLLFSAAPALAGTDPGAFRTWAPIAGSLLATVLLAIAPYLSGRLVRRPDQAVRRMLAGCVAGLAVLAVLLLVFASDLPVGVRMSLAAVDATRPHLGQHILVTAVQLASMVLLAAAAAGFAMRAAHQHDVLARWLAVGAVLGAFARLNYGLFPSLYTEYFYVGDILRLGYFVAVFAGTVQETRRLQRQLADAAVADERHRIARDIHDGVAQDLAFVLQQLRRIAEHVDAPPVSPVLVQATERALDESRHAIAALARPIDRPLHEAIAMTAREAGEREGSTVVTDLDEGVAVPPPVQEELLRVVREAVINAARHGDAQTITVTLRDRPCLRVTVSDDGRGFAPQSAGSGRSGVVGMHARVDRIGGTLSIRSTPGAGTCVQVDLP